MTQKPYQENDNTQQQEEYKVRDDHETYNYEDDNLDKDATKTFGIRKIIIATS